MLLQAQDLSCVRGGVVIFDHVTLSVRAGEALWVKGRNGSGKTSLLRMLCGLAQPWSGSVQWRGGGLRQRRDEFHRELRYVGHQPSLKDDLDALENLQFGARLSGTPCSQVQAEAALERVGLGRAARVPARSLSQGQRRRVGLASLALTPRPQLMVLDEPFDALDDSAVDLLKALLEEHLSRGSALVYTTHQPQTLRAPHLPPPLTLERVRAC